MSALRCGGVRSGGCPATPRLVVASVSIIGMAFLRIVPVGHAQLVESERLEEYHRRGHEWPPRLEEYNPPTRGWQQLMSRRFRQLDQMPRPQDGASGALYNGYVSTTYAALLAPNFTEFGWALTKAPEHVVQPLLQTLHDGLAHSNELHEEPAEDEEDDDDDESAPSLSQREYPLYLPLMVPRQDLYDWVLRQVQPLLESWIGGEIPLVANNAYGLRVYRNHSMLHMHMDRAATHVISAILHVDHDPLSEPWPLVIEDLHGNTHEVCLQTGDMLLYESSKMLHGRPRRFNGAWYTSLFLHFFPEGWAYDDGGDHDSSTMEQDVHYRIPPVWLHGSQDADLESILEVRETSFAEPDCGTHEWCALPEEPTHCWTRPLLKPGQVVSSDGILHSLSSQTRQSSSPPEMDGELDEF